MKKSPVVHFEMPAKDKERVSRFYKSVFGWGISSAGPDMGDYLMATTTDTGENGRPNNPGAINGGFFDYSDKHGFNAPHIVIAVDNINEIVDLIKKEGGTLNGSPFNIPGVGLYVSITDTEGNCVGVLQPSQM